jgi:hypothetical protein
MNECGKKRESVNCAGNAVPHSTNNDFTLGFSSQDSRRLVVDLTALAPDSGRVLEDVRWRGAPSTKKFRL